MVRLRGIVSSHLFWVCVIVGIGLFFRLYHFPARVSLGSDSSRDVFVTIEGSRSLQLPLIGPFNSVAPVVSTPWYWVGLIFTALIFKTPYAPWIFIATYSILEMLVMYGIGRVLEGKKFGLLLALIAALSPQQIGDAVGLNNHAVVGFYASLTILFYVLLLKRGAKKWLGFLFGLALGLTISVHYQAVGLVSLGATLLVYGKKYLKSLVFAAIGLVLVFVPLIIFELLNHWYNVRNLTHYLLVDQYKIWVPKRWLTYVFDYWPKFMTFAIGGTPLFGKLILAAIVICMLWLLFKRKLPRPYLLIGATFILQIIIVRYYRGELFYGYLKFIHPYVFLFTGYMLYKLMSLVRFRVVGLLLIIGYMAVVLPTSWERLEPEGISLEMEQLYKEVVAKYGPGPFKLVKCNTANLDRIEALAAKFYIKGVYSSENSKTIAYHWGCDYPALLVNNKVITPDMMENKEQYFPKLNYAIEDFSLATPAALLKAGWREVSAKNGYQSAARWWYDEQP